MTIVVTVSEDITAAKLVFHDLEYRCCIGAGGATSDKREGDQCTPLGVWPLRRVFYRPDRTAAPITRQPIISMDKFMGWSDDSKDTEHYNRLVSLPYPGGHETLWRDDNVYNIVVELGYNDDPPVPGLGSAIFLHVAQPDFAPTQGCVALCASDLLELLSRIGPDESLTIQRESSV
jgi:L,D-peptidoglycan transpeptidase YkuD (ErfK/YbiS/YcfS/YnhG family)